MTIMMTLYCTVFLLVCGIVLPSPTSELNTDSQPMLDAAEMMDLFSDTSRNFFQEQYVSVPFPITDWCNAWLQKFALLSAEFFKCGVQRARPFRLCRNCLQQYLRTHNFILDLQTQDSKIKNASQRCFPRLINSDVINVVGQVRDFVESIWTDSACDHCFEKYDFENGTIDAELTNLTKRYLFQYNVTDYCISKYITYVNGTKTYDQYACIDCTLDYINLNEIYSEMNEGMNDKLVCMDVTDAMNYTRYLWSEDFQCNISDPNEAVVLGTCGSIFILPILFYLVSKFQGNVRKKKLMKLKRLNFRRGSWHARLLQSASLVYSDQVNEASTSRMDPDNARRLNITPDNEVLVE